MPLAHCSAAHSVPFGYLWQPPAPSQVPSVPHERRAGPCRRRRVGRGGGTGAQTPSEVDSEQLRQLPLQACRSRRRRRRSRCRTRCRPSRAGPWLLARSFRSRRLWPSMQSASLAQWLTQALARSGTARSLDALGAAGPQAVARAGRVHPVARARRRDAHRLGGILRAPAQAVAGAGLTAGRLVGGGADLVRVGGALGRWPAGADAAALVAAHAGAGAGDVAAEPVRAERRTRTDWTRSRPRRWDACRSFRSRT